MGSDLFLHRFTYVWRVRPALGLFLCLVLCPCLCPGSGPGSGPVHVHGPVLSPWLFHGPSLCPGLCLFLDLSPSPSLFPDHAQNLDSTFLPHHHEIDLQEQNYRKKKTALNLTAILFLWKYLIMSIIFHTESDSLTSHTRISCGLV